MANLKISQLTSAPSVSSSDVCYVVSGGVSYKTTAGEIAAVLLTRVPIDISGVVNAELTWAGRVIRATAASTITVPDTFPEGFTFDVQSATAGIVDFALDGSDVFEPSFGDGTGVTAVAITEQNGWASVMKVDDGIIAIVGQIEDATP